MQKTVMRGCGRTALALVLCSALFAVTGRARADGVPIEEATPAQLSAAQKTFEAADELYDGKQYEPAIKAFRTSFDIVASPNSLLMISRCLDGLGRAAEAYTELEGAVGLAEKAAAKDAKYQPTLGAVRGELAELKRKVSIVHLRVADLPPGATVSVGGKPVDPAKVAKPQVVNPGKVEVIAKADGYHEFRAEVDAKAGAEQDVAIQLTPADAPPPATTAAVTTTTPPPDTPPSGASPLRTAAFVAGGFGAANLIAFAIFGSIHSGKYSDLEDACPQGRCPADQADNIDSGKTFQTLANTSLVLGAVGVAAGVTLFVLSTRKSSSAPPTARASVSAAPGMLRLTGKF